MTFARDAAAQPDRSNAVSSGRGPDREASGYRRLHRPYRRYLRRAVSAPPELRDQRIFEHYAGRPLEPAERVRAGTVYKMTSAPVELAKTLALKDLTVAFLYLSRVAPDETIEQRQHVAKHLAGLV